MCLQGLVAFLCCGNVVLMVLQFRKKIMFWLKVLGFGAREEDKGFCWGTMWEALCSFHFQSVINLIV